jgi:hypothetical protein
MVIKGKNNGYFFFFFPKVISQDFKAQVIQESYVILGNDALVKCDIPSFVADLVQITGWNDNDGNEYIPTANNNFGKQK